VYLDEEMCSIEKMSEIDVLIMQLSFNSSFSQEKPKNINFILEQIFISNLSFNNFDLCWNFLRKNMDFTKK
jgi:hypothetical protein